MKQKVEEFIKEVEEFKTSVVEELEEFRIKFLGKKGLVKDLFNKFKEVPNEQKKNLGNYSIN